jgi:hypothetical protein
MTKWIAIAAIGLALAGLQLKTQGPPPVDQLTDAAGACRART